MRDRQISEVEEMETAMDLRRDESSEPKKQVELPAIAVTADDIEQLRLLNPKTNRVGRRFGALLFSCVRMLAAKDTELETLRARVEELEEQVEELEGTESRYAAALIGHADAESRLRAVSEALENNLLKAHESKPLHWHATKQMYYAEMVDDFLQRLRAIVEGK